MVDQIILRIVTKWMMPYILVFGLYTIVHGELGPGGGFQGGVIVAAAFILYGLVFGTARMREVLPVRVSDAVACAGVLVYAGVGLACVLLGHRFLDYTPLAPGDLGIAEFWGMTLVEYGVGLTVSMVMVTAFAEIARPPAAARGETVT